MTYYGSRYKLRQCPGCGAEYHMPAQKLCNDCKEAVRIGLIQQKRLENMKGSDDKIFVKVGTDFLPTPTNLWPHMGQYTVERRDFIKAVQELAGELPDERNSFGFHGRVDEVLHCRSDGYHETTVVFWMAQKKLESLKTIMAFIKESFQIIGNNGIDYGRNILVSLASGGLKYLNSATTKRG